MAKLQKNTKDQKKIYVSPFKDYWNRFNYLILLAGLGALIIGFFLLGQGTWDSKSSLFLSPVILVIAYLLIIPLSIFVKLSKNKK